MRALLFLLIPALAFADRPECEKAGGTWTTDMSGTGCVVRGKKVGVWENHTPTGQLLTRMRYVDGKLEGPTVSFHDTCEIAETGQYKDNKKTGAWASWFDNGQRQAEGPYTDDLRNGTWKFYQDDAAILEGPMVNDAATGTFTERFTTGITWRTDTEMIDGVRTTPDAKACQERGGSYDVDYKRRTEGCVVDEKREGPWQGYSPEGKLEWRTEYVGGLEHGEHIDYHPTGQILRKGRYMNGNPTGTHEFRSATNQLYGTSTVATSGRSPWKAFFSDGIVAEEGEHTNGVRDGVWKTFQRKGAPLDETTWNMGVRFGPFREMWPTGELKISGRFANDIRAGIWNAYFMNGALVWSGGYDERGRQKGMWFNGNFDGTAAAFGPMLNNKRHGVWTELHEGGVIAGTGLYDFGKRTGTWFQWWPSGRFWRTVEYVNGVEDSEPARACFASGGKWISDDTERALGCQVCRSTKDDAKGPVEQLKIGVWTWWHTSAAVEKQGAFVLGKREGEWRSWFDNGQLMLVTTYKADAPQGAARGFFREGKKRFEGTYANGVEEGEWTTWHSDGSIAAIGRYSAGKKTGRWKYNYPGGTLKEEGDYDAGQPAGTWTSYHPNGAKASQGAYVGGKRDGEWMYWRPDGGAWRTERLVAGKRI